MCSILVLLLEIFIQNNPLTINKKGIRSAAVLKEATKDTTDGETMEVGGGMKKEHMKIKDDDIMVINEVEKLDF